MRIDRIGLGIIVAIAGMWALWWAFEASARRHESRICAEKGGIYFVSRQIDIMTEPICLRRDAVIEIK